MGDFRHCLAYTLREESGEVQPIGGPYVRGKWSFMDHPKDPGGATMMGITHRVYEAWLDTNNLPQKDVREVTDAEIEHIYAENYWMLVRGDELPDGLALAVFDFAVNSGPHRAITKLQSVLGVIVDGQLGVATLRAAREQVSIDLIRTYMNARRDFCRRLSNYPYFKNGWSKRWDRIEVASVMMYGGHPVDVVPDEVIAPPALARAEEAPPTSMVKSDTGNTAVTVGGTGVAGVGLSVSKAAQATVVAGKPLTLTSLILAATSTPEFWLALVALAGGALIWFERRRKMQMEA